MHATQTAIKLFERDDLRSATTLHLLRLVLDHPLRHVPFKGQGALDMGSLHGALDDTAQVTSNPTPFALLVDTWISMDQPVLAGLLSKNCSGCAAMLCPVDGSS